MATLSELRKFMEGAADRLTPAKAQDIAKGLMQGQGREQIQKAAQEILEWSTKNRDRLGEVVRREVASQMKSLGVATRDELEALRKRVRDLERASGSKPTARTTRTAPKRSSAKRTTARSSTSST
jgi:polyhydroxyalkanoate synthesis regulator phasin